MLPLYLFFEVLILVFFYIALYYRVFHTDYLWFERVRQTLTFPFPCP